MAGPVVFEQRYFFQEKIIQINRTLSFYNLYNMCKIF